jgi:hypothetical protein
MNDSSLPATGSATGEDAFAGLFAQLVMQQANMAMMLLGKVPHPETGETIKDTDAARLFIDQLEMLETKTKGNLSKEESALLKQSLMSLRLAFVDAVDSSSPLTQKAPQGESGKPGVETSGTTAAEPPSPSAVEDEHRKKFSKKY